MTEDNNSQRLLDQESSCFSLSLTMDLNRDRNELMEMIDQIQNAQLMANIKEVVGDLLHPSNGFVLSEEHQKIIDERIDKYRSGEGKLFTWEEVVEEARSK